MFFIWINLFHYYLSFLIDEIYELNEKSIHSSYQTQCMCCTLSQERWRPNLNEVQKKNNRGLNRGFCNTILTPVGLVRRLIVPTWNYKSSVQSLILLLTFHLCRLFIWYTCRIILKEAQIFLFLLRKWDDALCLYYYREKGDASLQRE